MPSTITPCLLAQEAFFFKQWGGTNRKKTGRELEGRTWDAGGDFRFEFGSSYKLAAAENGWHK